MPETITPCDVVQVEYVCDKEGCGGKVAFTGKAVDGIDPKQKLLLHVCIKCKSVYKFKGLPYPRNEYQPKNI